MEMDVISRVAERQIQEAIEEGKFDDLPGKGKPIVFDEDPTVPIHIRLANKVLKDAGVVPEWVQFRRDILEERKSAESLKQRLCNENQTRRERLTTMGFAPTHPSMLAYAQWRLKSREKYLSTLKSVNTSILKFCMHAPTTAYNADAFASYRIDAEMKRFDEDFPAIEALPHIALKDDPSEGTLRSFARTRYEVGSQLKRLK